MSDEVETQRRTFVFARARILTGLRSWLENCNKPFQTIASLVIIGGIPSYFIQRNIAEHQTRVETTLEFARTYRSTNFSEIRYSLVKFWSEQDEFLNHIKSDEILKKAGVEAAIDEGLETYAKNHPESDLEYSLFQIVDFYDQLEICLAVSACDQKTALKLFTDDVSSFHFFFWHRILEKRESLLISDYGSGIERIYKLVEDTKALSTPPH